MHSGVASFFASMSVCHATECDVVFHCSPSLDVAADAQLGAEEMVAGLVVGDLRRFAAAARSFSDLAHLLVETVLEALHELWSTRLLADLGAEHERCRLSPVVELLCASSVSSVRHEVLPLLAAVAGDRVLDHPSLLDHGTCRVPTTSGVDARARSSPGPRSRPCRAARAAPRRSRPSSASRRPRCFAATAGSATSSESRDGPRSTLSLITEKKPTLTLPIFLIRYGANTGLPGLLVDQVRAHHGQPGAFDLRPLRKPRPKRRSRSPTPTASVPSSFIASMRNHATSCWVSCSGKNPPLSTSTTWP